MMIRKFVNYIRINTLPSSSSQRYMAIQPEIPIGSIRSKSSTNSTNANNNNNNHPASNYQSNSKEIPLQEVSLSNDFPALKWSLNPAHTLQRLRNHTWSAYDAQHIVIAIILLFSVSMLVEPGPFTKTALGALLIAGLIIPVSQQLLLPGLPVITWLIFFQSCKFIPSEWRPEIWVRLLPALENILYGANLSNILAKHTNSFLDVMAWIPYGTLHFASPVICCVVLFVFCPPKTVPVFVRSFGYMNITAVMTQIIFPCSPPWYENMYGLAPANYGISGSPGGLIRIDELLHTHTYMSAFTASPVVFGAFPSLHSGWATLISLFLSHRFPRYQSFFYGYVLWIWWTTMYLTHHYFVDLIGGSCLAVAVWYIAHRHFLPRAQMGKSTRWEYEYISRGFQRESSTSLPLYGRSQPSENRYGDVSSKGDWALASSGSASPLSEGSTVWENDDGEIRAISPAIPQVSSKKSER